MGNFVGLHHKIYLGHINMTGIANEVNFGDLRRQMVPCTTFADGGYNCVKPGLISGSGAVRGYQDYATNPSGSDGFDDEISTGQLGSQYAFSVAPNPTGTLAVGDAAWFSRGVIAGHSPLAGTPGGMAEFDLSNLAFDTAVLQGKVAALDSAILSGTGTGTAVALTGPTASQRLYAALHVTGFAGTANVTFKVQTDDNGSFTSATDRITFTAATTETSEFASVAGAFSSETHVRLTWTLNSGSAFFAAFAAVAVF